MDDPRIEAAKKMYQNLVQAEWTYDETYDVYKALEKYLQPIKDSIPFDVTCEQGDDDTINITVKDKIPGRTSIPMFMAYVYDTLPGSFPEHFYSFAHGLFLMYADPSNFTIPREKVDELVKILKVYVESM